MIANDKCQSLIRHFGLSIAKTLKKVVVIQPY